MKVRTVTWGRTKSHNYQSTRAEVTLEIGEGESIEEATQHARDLVDVALHDPEWLGEQPSKNQIAQAKERIAAQRAKGGR